MRILVTGAAGFIGSALAVKLLDRGLEVVGVDNHNDYYDPELKEARLRINLKYSNYNHHRISIANRTALEKVFADCKPQRVVNLAAQAGVRYSIENPYSYIESNVVGFINILECCRHSNVEHLVYASSSSVYGANSKMPFSVEDNVNHPLSLYAASKKSNELMAHTYSHLYDLPTTGLRFFTVYGPWGRPDMALFKFTKLMLEGKKIQVYNFGRHRRDFTYIDDIVEGVVRVLDKVPQGLSNWDSAIPQPSASKAPWRLYNIGAGRPTDLMDFIVALENSLGLKASLEFLPLQSGDVPDTSADIENLYKEFSYKPFTQIETGIKNFVEWYKEYFRP